ncbi:MAG: quinone-dependent dihydroorotate dehydrogenase [Pseudomonadota bacterium]|nr:quinone-dependent dihydroorotate dehydrogenase [Pseudomonadota bacterium]
MINLGLYKYLVKPFLYRMDAEKAHNLSLQLLKFGFVPSIKQFSKPELAQDLWGMRFENPIGLAAGFDKNAIAVGGLNRLGFGFIELGTVTPKPQAGNARPRIFRLSEDEGVINRLGFNNHGLETFKTRLSKFRSDQLNTIIGVNIGKNRDSSDPIADYVECMRKCYSVSDYIVLNISSPNTPGLRNLQTKSSLEELLSAVFEENSPAQQKTPILLKISPDLSENEIVEVAEAAKHFKVRGLIATNTTTSRSKHLGSKNKTEKGGLSGRPLFRLSTQVLKLLYRHTDGRIPIIGVGGVRCGKDAYSKIRSGASLIQIYTAMIYQGPYVAHKIACELSSLLKKDGLANVKDAVGIDVYI